jgi:peptidoglycan hydrolase-like protein with peptidoglycan-binding domain
MNSNSINNQIFPQSFSVATLPFWHVCYMLWRSSLWVVLSLLTWNLVPLSADGNGAIAQTSPQDALQHSTPTPSRPTLRMDNQGDAVSELQALLKLLGYYTGSVDGQYQQSTADAVTAFQRAAGLDADGIVGPMTWEQLLPTSASAGGTATTAIPLSPNASSVTQPRATPAVNPEPNYVELPILRIGMRGPAVSRLQERLRTTGFFEGTVDGIFGPETELSVRSAQRTNSLAPDGVVGPATWTILLR